MAVAQGPVGGGPQPKRLRQARARAHGQPEVVKLRHVQRIKALVVDVAGLEPLDVTHQIVSLQLT